MLLSDGSSLPAQALLGCRYEPLPGRGPLSLRDARFPLLPSFAPRMRQHGLGEVATRLPLRSYVVLRPTDRVYGCATKANIS